MDQAFQSSAAAEDDVQEDDIEMTVEGGASSAEDPADEDPFEKQMRLSYESQVRPRQYKDIASHRLSIN